MNDLSKSLKILVDRYPGTMAELARQAQIDRSSLYKIMDGKRMPNRAQLRPVMYLTCIAAVCLFELLVLKLAKGPRSGQLIRILPVAAVNSGVLGTVLVERTQSFTLEQSLGFGLGSGLGYLLAVMLVTEAQNRLRSRAIPEAFRGLPVTLIYIGVLALAIYGFTGHSVIL